MCNHPKQVWIVASNSEKRQAVAYRPGCGLWSCDKCARENALKWVARAAFGTETLLAADYKMGFVTVTSRGGNLSPARSVVIFGQAWPKLSRAARKVAGGTLEYFLVPERQKNGKIHAHILASAMLGQRFWKDKAYWSGLGYIANEQPLTAVGGAVKYVTKYLTKQITETRWPEGFRRVRVSNGWPKLPEHKREGWDYEVFKKEGGMWWEIHYLRDAGYTVDVMQDHNLASGLMTMKDLQS